MGHALRNAIRSLHLVALLVGLCLGPLASRPAAAQDATPEAEALPSLRITGINTSQFPDVQVTLYGENLGIDLAQLPLTLREDTDVRSETARQLSEVGIQTAFVLDASGSMRADSLWLEGRPRYEEFRAAIERFLDLGVLSAQTDWLAAYTTGATEDEFRTISPWTQDHNALLNAALQDTPQDQATLTPLFDLIGFALDRFDDAGVPANANRSLIVFSDGDAANSDLDDNNVIARADEMNVRIYTVMIGPELDDGEGLAAEQRKNNLEGIARLTSGAYTLLDAPDRLDAVWNALAGQRTQLAVNYHLGRAQPQQLEVVATLPNRPALTRTAAFPVVGAKPVQIEVVDPPANTPIVRSGGAFDTPLGELEPRELPIQLRFTWPEGQPARQLTRVEYTINDNTQVQAQEPYDQFVFPIADLPAGDYTLRVRAFDELGVEANSAPFPLAVRTQLPLPPTATPLPTATVAPTPAPVVEPPPPFPYLRTLLLSGLLLFLLAFLFYRRRRRQQEAPETEIDYPAGGALGRIGADWSLDGADRDLGDVTEVPAAPPFNPVPAAYLVLEDSEHRRDHLPKRITLHIDSVVRIGRRPDLSDVVLDDRQVSRAHAIVTHKEDGFHIQDNGSKGGTYVNKRRLAAGDDRLLKPGDAVHFFDIAYEFEVADEYTEVPDEAPFAEPEDHPSGTDAASVHEDRTEPVAYDRGTDDGAER